MIVTNNLCRVDCQQKTKPKFSPVRTIANNGLYNRTFFSQPSFAGVKSLKDMLLHLLPKPKTPVEQAKKYIEAGSELAIKEVGRLITTGYQPFNKSFEKYKKAVELLEKNWPNLDKQGKETYITASFCMAGSRAKQSVPCALLLLKNLFAKLSKTEEPMLKDSETLNHFLINSYVLAKIAMLKGNHNNAKECFKFGKRIAEFADAAGIKLSGSKDEDAVTYFGKKILAIEELER